MELAEIMSKLREKYHSIDAKSGELFLLAVLFEEVGELAEVVRKRDVEGIEEELTDVLFMTLSLANLFGLDVEKRLVEKYLERDPSSDWDLPS